jgi:hypothetical protein
MRLINSAMKLNSPEYLTLKKFLANVWPLIHLEPRPPEVHPIFNLEILEKERPSRAGEGLQMVVDDILSQSVRWSKEEIKEYDRILDSKSCLTISGARKEYWKKIPQLLNSKRIRTEVDYYFLKSLYDDSEALFDDDEILIVVQLLQDFENRRGGKLGSG